MWLLYPLHLLSAVVWIGGMFFAYVALRPVAASLLEPPLRLPLWEQVFARFFPWVWVAVVSLPLSGYWMLLGYFGGFAGARWYVHAMNAIGTLMILLFLHLYFAPYRRLREALAGGDLPEAGRRLAQIRRMVGINLALGLVLVVLVGAGRFAG